VSASPDDDEVGAVLVRAELEPLLVLPRPLAFQLALVPVASTAAFVAVELEKWIIRRRSEGPARYRPDGPPASLPGSSRLVSSAGEVRPPWEVMTVTATVVESTTLGRQLGTVGEAMARDVVLLAADMTAEMALRRLDQKAVSGAPVVDHGRVVGVVTRRDLLVPMLLDEPSDAQAPGRWTRLTGLRVSDLMTGEPVTAQPDWSVVLAVRTMLDHGVNRLPVVDRAGRPLGVLTRDDVLGAVARGVQP
jgi:CBS domain-containing protein